MKQYNKPEQRTWKKLTERPTAKLTDVNEKVEKILAAVKKNGDRALFKFNLIYEGYDNQQLKVPACEIEFAISQVDEALKQAILIAKNNIEKFHRVQQEEVEVIETSKGVQCWRKSIGIDKVGLYIPGGSAPLFSTILMLGIPAKLAEVGQIVLCTPPDKKGNIHPAILYTAYLLGITELFKVGGAQAIAAMAYGTSSIPKVDKIFGPGNQYVTKAKEYIQSSGIAIDLPAGPSELLIIADASANPSFIAADLLAQAEHGADSQVMLVSNDLPLIQASLKALESQLVKLPRKHLASLALKESKAILLDNIESCLSFSNQYAPEHLIIATENTDVLASKVTNAGSVFLGNYSCESAGDYASGTNHTLPTNGFAKSYSGVSIDSFVKKITFQKISREGIIQLGPFIETMAQAEDLFAHKNAVTIRLKNESI